MMIGVRPCPQCGEQPAKVIFFGFPMLLCMNEACCCLFGFWSFIHGLAPIATETEEGPRWKFLAYEGWYIPALIVWLFGKHE